MMVIMDDNRLHLKYVLKNVKKNSSKLCLLDFSCDRNHQNSGEVVVLKIMKQSAVLRSPFDICISQTGLTQAGSLI